MLNWLLTLLGLRKKEEPKPEPAPAPKKKPVARKTVKAPAADVAKQEAKPAPKRRRQRKQAPTQEK